MANNWTQKKDENYEKKDHRIPQGWRRYVGRRREYLETWQRKAVHHKQILLRNNQKGSDIKKLNDMLKQKIVSVDTKTNPLI